MYYANQLTTISHPYRVARALAGFDTLIDLTAASDAAQRPSDVLDLLAVDIVTPKDVSVFPETVVNGICFIFAGSHGSDADNKDLAWRLLAWRNSNGPAEIVADGTAKTGTQAVVTYPHNGNATGALVNWCDTIVITNEYWPKEMEATAAGGDSISKLFLDTAGYRYWKMEITTSGTPIVNSAVFYGYF